MKLRAEPAATFSSGKNVFNYFQRILFPFFASLSRHFSERPYLNLDSNEDLEWEFRITLIKVF
jgi:hypothetical protein